MIKLIFLLLVTINVANADMTLHDKILQTIIKEFEQRSNIKVKLPVRFSRLEEGTLGTCTIYSNGYREINIDITSWLRSSDLLRRTTVIHELGHCVLSLPHVEHNLSYRDGCYTDLMKPYSDSSECEAKVAELSIDNFFKRYKKY